MSRTDELMAEYGRRTGRPGAMELDVFYNYETALLRDLLSRLEVILEDEEVPAGTVHRVIRCMLYGSPSPAAAQYRVELEQRVTTLAAKVPPDPLFLRLGDRKRHG